MEDILRLRPDFHRITQINPNLSSTNIAHLNHLKPVRPLFIPFSPITPPSSIGGTPVLEARDSFLGNSFHSHGSSLNLNAVSEKFQPKESSLWLRKWLPHVDLEVTFLCFLWYAFSIISANSTKAILLRFLYPVTLTQFQFVLNSALCIILFFVLTLFPSSVTLFPMGSVPNVEKLHYSVKNFITPSSFVISTTLPMGIFQFVGHITSHNATSMIPVSLVHTVKALSPITTVLIYRVLYKVRFKKITYITLVPLMVGIMLTCYRPVNSTKINGYVSGLVYASISMLIFVSQNIFAKKRLTVKDEGDIKPRLELPTHNKSGSKKLDKLTILFFCSLIGFLFTMPVYIFSEFRNEVFSLSEVLGYLLFLIVLNGISHFMQSLLAFLLLGTISPVNYSIVNIMKRIAVIGFAFFWESSFKFSPTQSIGLILTGIGLYCYDKWGIHRS